MPKEFFLGIVTAIALSSCLPIASNSQQQPVGRISPATPAKAKITQSQVSSDVDRLLKQIASRIELPYRPTTVLWQTTQIGDGVLGPSDWTLTAVMTFKAIDANKMVAAAKQQGLPREDFITLENWFPAQLKTLAVKDPQSGKYRLKVKVYQVSANQGQLMQVEQTPYWILYLFTT
jgi:hypothetical protein